MTCQRDSGAFDGMLCPSQTVFVAEIMGVAVAVHTFRQDKATSRKRDCPHSVFGEKVHALDRRGGYGKYLQRMACRQQLDTGRGFDYVSQCWIW